MSCLAFCQGVALRLTSRLQFPASRRTGGGVGLAPRARLPSARARPCGAACSARSPFSVRPRANCNGFEICDRWRGVTMDAEACVFIVGTTIGSGIFVSPGLVLLQTRSCGAQPFDVPRREYITRPTPTIRLIHHRAGIDGVDLCRVHCADGRLHVC